MRKFSQGDILSIVQMETRSRSRSNRPVAAIFKIGLQNRKLNQEEQRRDVMDASVARYIDYFNRLDGLGLGDIFQRHMSSERAFHQPEMFQKRIDRLNQIDLYEFEHGYVDNDRNIKKRKARINNMTMGMIYKNNSRFNNTW